MEAIVRQGKQAARKAGRNQFLRLLGEGLLFLLGGFALAAGSLQGGYQSLVPGLLCTIGGMPAVCTAIGGMLGYRWFWGEAAIQAQLWVLLCLGVGLLLSQRPMLRNTRFLLPALAGLIVAGCGVGFQSFAADSTPVPRFLLRVAVAMGTAELSLRMQTARTELTDMLAGFLVTLCLSQITLPGGISLGLISAGFLSVGSSFPGVVLAGAALDVARVSLYPMGAVLCLGYLGRFLPERYRLLRCSAAGLGFLCISSLMGSPEWMPALSLLLGGCAALLLPYSTPVPRRFGHTGTVQVQLELVSGVLARSEELISAASPPPVDGEALLAQTLSAACHGCPCRKSCKKQPQLSLELLTKKLPTVEDISCRKPGRILAELQHSRSRYRQMMAEQQRRKQEIQAVCQQYRFLSDYLQGLSAGFVGLRSFGIRYTPEVAVCSAGKQSINGDAGLWFSGTGSNYYLLLCDGMGTGSLAAKESRESSQMLKRLLTGGYPAAHAMESLNSLSLLRGEPGIVTADLAEIARDSGKLTLYKWGACPSFHIRGSAVTPLGGKNLPLGTGQKPETLHTFLRYGDYLVLMTDGVSTLPELPPEVWRESPGEIAAAILNARSPAFGDDATVLVMRLGR